MTNEELMSGFLDRSLSEDQLVELEARKADDPAFANELREMIVVENALRTSTPTTVIPTDFLAHVENTVAAKVAAGSSTGILAGISTAWKVVGASAIALGTAAGVYVATQNTAQHAPKVSTPSPINKPVTRPALTQPTLEAEPATSSAPATTVRTATPRPEPAVQASRPTATNDEASVNANASVQDAVLNKLIKQFNDCQASNDNTRCAQFAISIGSKFRQNRNYTEAADYYTKALNAARAMKIVQYEVDALGGLGLLSRDQGNTSDARERLRTAIERGSTVGGVNVDPYRRALEQLGD